MSEIRIFASLDFRNLFMSENQTLKKTLSKDFRHFTKVSETQNLGSDFRQCLKSELFATSTVIQCLKPILQ